LRTAVVVFGVLALASCSPPTSSPPTSKPHAAADENAFLQEANEYGHWEGIPPAKLLETGYAVCETITQKQWEWKFISAGVKAKLMGEHGKVINDPSEEFVMASATHLCGMSGQAIVDYGVAHTAFPPPLIRPVGTTIGSECHTPSRLSEDSITGAVMMCVPSRPDLGSPIGEWRKEEGAKAGSPVRGTNQIGAPCDPDQQQGGLSPDGYWVTCDRGSLLVRLADGRVIPKPSNWPVWSIFHP
jgi:hypothetical protein